MKKQEIDKEFLVGLGFNKRLPNLYVCVSEKYDGSIEYDFGFEWLAIFSGMGMACDYGFTIEKPTRQKIRQIVRMLK